VAISSFWRLPELIYPRVLNVRSCSPSNIVITELARAGVHRAAGRPPLPAYDRIPAALTGLTRLVAQATTCAGGGAPSSEKHDPAPGVASAALSRGARV
jgi:hypothetical protein